MVNSFTASNWGCMQEEATIVTGASDPQKAAAQVLSFPDSCTRWCIIKLGDRGAAIFPRGGQPVWAPAFQVCRWLSAKA